jgi:hypothetical protein
MGIVVDKAHYHNLEKLFPGTTVQQHNWSREIDPMPAKAPWLLHIPAIIAMLETFDVPVVDRAVIEHLFGLRRRRAIELLHRFGGYQTGCTLLADRQKLILDLRNMVEGEEYQRETRRKERLGDAVDSLRRHQAAARVKIPVAPDVVSRKMAGLSRDVALGAGHLHIAFQGVEDLLAKLYELSQAAANDFECFRALAIETKGSAR